MIRVADRIGDAPFDRQAITKLHGDLHFDWAGHVKTVFKSRKNNKRERVIRRSSNREKKVRGPPRALGPLRRAQRSHALGNGSLDALQHAQHLRLRGAVAAGAALVSARQRRGGGGGARAERPLGAHDGLAKALHVLHACARRGPVGCACEVG